MLLQFDQDLNSDYAELFLYLQKIILSYREIKEVKNAKQTSYKDHYSTVCMLRVRKGKVRLSFANGARMKAQFTELLGDAKIVRYLEFNRISEINSPQLKAMLQESQMLTMEKYERRLLLNYRKECPN